MSSENEPGKPPGTTSPTGAFTVVERHLGGRVVPFASGHVRAVCAMAMVAVACLASLLLATSTNLQIGPLKRAMHWARIMRVEATANEVQAAIVGLKAILFVASGIAFLLWFHRAYRNLRALGNRTTEYSPAGAVGWWFVPIASLVVPCQMAMEIWRGSHPKNIDPLSPKKVRHCWLVGWWWAFFVVMCILGDVPAMVSKDCMTWYCIASVPAGVLAILFIRGVDRNQESRHEIIQMRQLEAAAQPVAAPQDAESSSAGAEQFPFVPPPGASPEPAEEDPEDDMPTPWLEGN
jgi:heme/copper-type cytochrome/quinol oxidase subunit 2